MHWTEERTAKARIGQALRARGWTIWGFKEDRSDPMTDTYDPESWDGVATHPSHPGIVACVKVGEYVVERASGQDGWPNFQATLSGKAWHVQKDGVVVGQGVGLSKCAGHGDDWKRGVAGVCDAIERAARQAAGATPPLSKAGSATLQGRVQIEHDRDWTWVFLPSRPDEATRERLKGMGARWGHKRGGWYLTRHVSLAELAWLTAGPPADPMPDPIQPQPGGFHPRTAQEALERACFVYGHQPPAEKQDAYDVLPAWLAPHIPRLYSQDEFKDPITIAKYFSCEGRWTFHVLEYSKTAPDGTPDLFFGYLLSPLGEDCDELCYMTLEQIRDLRSPTLNLPVERDLWFRPAPLSEIKHPYDRAGQPDKPPEPFTGQTPAIASNVPQQELAFADDGQSISFSNAEYRIAAAYVQRGENRYSPGWKIYRREAGNWTAVEEDQRASEAEWKQSLTLSGCTTQMITITKCVIRLLGKPDDLPDSYAYVSEDVVLAAQKQGATLPDPLAQGNWTADDLRFLLDRLERGPILVSGAGDWLGIPTIHQVPSKGATHCGMGVFKAVTPEYTIVFDAGSEMARTPSGHGYTRVDVRAGVFPYDIEDVRAKLEAWLQVTEERAARAEKEPELRSPAFGDWVRTPDGEIVQMRSSGAMGSNRVGGYDREGRQVGWYGRDELVFVSETMPAELEAQVAAPSPQPAIPAYAGTNPHLHQNTVQLNRELKRIDKELESLNARKDYAYEIAINDRGTSMDRLQREIDAVLEKRQQVVDALLAQQKPQAEAAPEPPQPEPFSITLAAWLDDEHHETQRSGRDMYYIRPDGERVLWPGTTSRYEVVVRQHRCEVERAIVEGYPITADVAHEYPDLAVQADEKGLLCPPVDSSYRSIWMRTRREFSVSHPMSAAGVPIGKVNAARERYHEIVVLDAIERGYPVPDRVRKDYAWQSGQEQPITEPSTARAEAEIEAQAQPSAAEEAVRPANDHPYTDTDVAAYETRWDVYLETGSLPTVRRTLKRIDAIGVLHVAFARAERGLSASTLEQRRKIIQQRIRQLEKAA